MTIAGCQGAKTVSYAYDAYRVLQQPDTTSNTIYMSCSAGQGCDFVRVDDVNIIDATTQRLTRQAIERGMIRLEGTVFSKQHQYAVSLVPGTHEVAMHFYPVSSERVEKFHLIHKFLAGHHYHVVMYRQKTASNGSLLNVAMPGSLCVDLLQDDIALRRFCRPFDVMTGLGEFVEQKI
ncbi:MAG: hypothetical protein E6Q25_00915 [Acinetobacter sp.]|nr:MAG: hypothetical protein E6Q25_00915 [Acinetobacter sp.]